MISAISLGLLVSAVFEIIKKGVLETLERLNPIIESAVKETCEEFAGLESDDFADFLFTDDVADEVWDMIEKGTYPDIDFLTEIFSSRARNSGISDLEGIDFKLVVTTFFQKLEENLIANPDVYERIRLRYMRNLQTGQQKLETDHVEIIELQREILAKLSDNISPEAFDPFKLGFQKVLSKLGQIAYTLNSRDEYYHHRIELTEEGARYQLSPKSPESASKEPIHGNLIINVQKRDGKTETLQEMLKEAVAEGKAVVLSPDDVEELNIFRGDEPIVLWSGVKPTITISPNRPPPRPFKISVPGYDLSYDYVMLERVRIKDEYITVSNINQDDYPVIFELEISRESPKALIHISPNEIGQDMISALDFFNFIKLLKDTGRIRIKDIQTNRTFVESEIKINGDIVNEAYYSTIKKAVEIQKSTRIIIPWPRVFTHNDLIAIDMAYNIINNGVILGRSDFFIIAKKGEGSESISKLLRDGYLDDVQISSRLEVNICGIVIDMGNGQTEKHRAFTNNDIDVIRDQYEKLEPGQELRIAMHSDKQVPFLFEKWPKRHA